MAETVNAQKQRLSDQHLLGENIQPPTTSSELYSLLDAVDSKLFDEQFGIDTYSIKPDFANPLNFGIVEGINPSSSLAERAEKIAIHDQMEEMAVPTFTRDTNDRDYRDVVRVLFGRLHRPSRIASAVSIARGWNDLIKQLSPSTKQILLS